jgi:hypothetical protein
MTVTEEVLLRRRGSSLAAVPRTYVKPKPWVLAVSIFLNRFMTFSLYFPLTFGSAGPLAGGAGSASMAVMGFAFDWYRHAYRQDLRLWPKIGDLGLLSTWVLNFIFVAATPRPFAEVSIVSTSPDSP